MMLRLSADEGVPRKRSGPVLPVETTAEPVAVPPPEEEAGPMAESLYTFCRVKGPAMPSAFRPFRLWKLTTAERVPASKLPSVRPGA